MSDSPTVQRDFSGGQCNNVNEALTPANTVDLGLNVDFDEEIGSAVSRLGSATVGSQLVAGNTVLGLHQYTDNTNASNNKLFATINASGGATSVIKNVATGTSTATNDTGLTASKKMRFCTFLGATLALNGADAERSYTNAGGWIVTGGAFDLANIPSSNTVNLCNTFLDRLYVAGDTAQPTRLYYSGLSSGTAVSWTVGNGYIDIDNNDGAGPITALAKVPGYELIFKQRAMHRWNFSSAFPESLIQIGTPSQESVVMAGGLCAFYSNSSESSRGFYVTNGSRPTAISHDNNRPIKKWIDAIPSANEANIAGYSDDRHFCWSVGDLTVDGESYTNVHLRYNRILNQWSVRTYPQEHKVFAQYLASGVNTIVGGDDNGYVAHLDVPGTYTDYPSATPIQWKVRQQHRSFGVPFLKTITDELVVLGRNIASAAISIIADENLEERKQVGPRKLFRRLLSLFGINEKIRGTTLAIEVSGESVGARCYVRQIAPKMTLDQTYTT